ncbi:MAG: nitroreductase family protein [Alphaproteobacteria bacterium]|nr:nitroreductase family protein [Alphaproteobacteria bacterium]
MNKKLCISVLASSLLCSNVTTASEINLPKPDISSPLMQIIDTRTTIRNISAKPISPETLSNILWSAFGTNSHNTRTIATGKNEQDLKIFVIWDKKVWLYDGINNKLNLYSETDLMPYLAKQDFVNIAPVHLIYAGGKHNAQAHSGSSYQNVYLYAAEQGLATVIRGYFDAEGVTKALNLPENEIVTYHQVIGYPDK